MLSRTTAIFICSFLTVVILSVVMSAHPAAAAFIHAQARSSFPVSSDLEESAESTPTPTIVIVAPIALPVPTLAVPNVVPPAHGNLPVAGQPVSLPDTNFAKAVREKLGKTEGPISFADMAGLTSLDLRGRSIANLTGLEWAIRLTYLNLDGNKVTDLSPLAGLTAMTELNAANNRISSLASLIGLTDLMTVTLSHNQISGIEPMANLEHVRTLDLSFNRISDIAPLALMEQLTSLTLTQNQISDLTPIGRLPSLSWLVLNDNKIEDLSGLADMPSLSTLDLSKNRITDISALSRLTNLRGLYLYHNYIADVSPLSGLTNLNVLNLEMNDVASVAPLCAHQPVWAPSCGKPDYGYLATCKAGDAVQAAPFPEPYRECRAACTHAQPARLEFGRQQDSRCLTTCRHAVSDISYAGRQ